MKRKRKRPLRGVEKGVMTSFTNDTVPVVVESSITIDAPTNHRPSVAITFPSRSIGLLSLIFGPIQRSMASLHNLWTNYYPPGAFGEESALMPGSDLNFIIIGLLAFVGIKAQGNTGFPFQTNPRTTMVSVSSLIMFAVASSAKHVFSVGRPALTSIYTVVARLGRMVSLVTLDQSARIQKSTPPPTTTAPCAGCLGFGEACPSLWQAVLAFEQSTPAANGSGTEPTGKPELISEMEEPKDASSSPKANGKNGIQTKMSESNVEALMLKLRHSYYYMKPTIQELAAKERAQPGYCGRVKDFVVGRHGLGSIKFLGETDLRGVDLESLSKSFKEESV